MSNKRKKITNIHDYDNDYRGATVLLRLDLNVTLKDGEITDDTRIKESINTIRYLSERGAKIVILSHLEKDKVCPSLTPVYERLKTYLDNINIFFSEEITGETVKEKIRKLKNGEVILLENTRHNNGEKKGDEAFAESLADLGDIFITDAFATIHRNHSSNAVIAKYMSKNAIGLLIQKELDAINEIIEGELPFTLIMGGKKVSDKLPIIKNLAAKCDKIILGGAMCFTFLKAAGMPIGSSIVDDEQLTFCKELLKKYEEKILLPVDVITQTGETKKIIDLTNNDIGYDIGPETRTLYLKVLETSKKVVWNGAMGVCNEGFADGTISLAKYLKDNNKTINTLIGGGDTVGELIKLGFCDCYFHMSTGGGALLAYLGGEKLPGIDNIRTVPTNQTE